MSILPFFLPPAEQDDFKDPNQYQKFVRLWSTYVNGFTQQSILGNPWTATNAQYQDYYYNPLTTDVPSSSTPAAIQWSAFPGRINFYFPNLGQADRWSLADTGYMTDGKTTFPQITSNPCQTQPPPPLQPYGPYGPRGWQDEYCEWSVTRDPGSNKITRLDFTCENPEYWRSLWHMDSALVSRLYQQTLGNPAIKIEDLYLMWNGRPVIDPYTRQPAYNPLNKWNFGTKTTPASGGAMHLTSTPNTLQTETGLAGAATVQRNIGNSDPEALICCAQYGQPHRNSDPHIGQVTNQVVGAQLRASLTNPTGLYIQMPDFSRYKLPPNAPPGTQPSQFWKVVRGTMSLKDQNGNPIPGNSCCIVSTRFRHPSALRWVTFRFKRATANTTTSNTERRLPRPFSCKSTRLRFQSRTLRPSSIAWATRRIRLHNRCR
jgi:hypothetical protein